MSRAQQIVGALLEDLPGVDEATLNEIMGVIFQAVDASKTGNPAVDQQKFEQLANPQLEKYGIKFDANDEVLVAQNKPARGGLDGLVIATPQRINRREFAYMREMISHELVHGDQMSRAMQTGNAAKMYQSAHRRILPQGIHGPMDYHAYLTDPHEVTAHARSAIDRMRRSKMTRPQAISALKAGQAGHQQKADPKSYKRFLKHAAGYAQDLPEK